MFHIFQKVRSQIAYLNYTNNRQCVMLNISLSPFKCEIYPPKLPWPITTENAVKSYVWYCEQQTTLQWYSSLVIMYFNYETVIILVWIWPSREPQFRSSFYVKQTSKSTNVCSKQTHKFIFRIKYRRKCMQCREKYELTTTKNLNFRIYLKFVYVHLEPGPIWFH